MAHASLRALGPVEERGAGVIRALDAAVSATGTVLMVLGAEDEWAWVNERPEHERAALLADAPPFDADETPAQADIGTLAELFRRAPGTRVSDHPEGRFGARGAHAAMLLADQPWDDYYGPGSPLARFVERGGKVLRLGADPDTVTVTHYAEYLAPLAEKRRVRRYRRVAGRGGPSIRVVESLDDEKGIADYEDEDYFATILRAFLETGRVSTGMVGAAHAELFDAAEFVEHAVTWMTAHLQ